MALASFKDGSTQTSVLCRNVDTYRRLRGQPIGERDWAVAAADLGAVLGRTFAQRIEIDQARQMLNRRETGWQASIATSSGMSQW